MSFLRHLAREYVIHRLLGPRHHRHRGRMGRPRGYGYRAYSPRSGFNVVRPRGGSRVKVGGCCLPIPLTLVVSAGIALGLMRR